MKKMKKRIFGLLMAGMMICLPAMQSLAQTCSANVMDPAPILFPGDVLTDIVAPVMLDGVPVAGAETPEAPAAWTNAEQGKVYRAALAEDGSGAITLALAGYELDVAGGTSEAGDETTGPIGGHYVNTPEEEALIDPAAPKTDRAYYPAGTVVKLSAEEPREGMMFDKWTVETPSGTVVTVAEETSSETTVTMPEEKVTVTANYCQAEAPTPYSLSVSYGTAAVENADGTGTYVAGTPITVIADDYTANGYTFSGWEVGPQNVELVLDDSGSAAASFVMPEGDVLLTAKYVDGEGIPVEDPTQPPQTETETPVNEETPPEPVYSDGTGELTGQTDPVYSGDTAELNGNDTTAPTYSDAGTAPDETQGSIPEVQSDPDVTVDPDVTTEPNMENGGESILSGGDPNAIDIMIGDSYSSNEPTMTAPAGTDEEETAPPAGPSAIRYMLNVDYGTVGVEDAEDADASQGFTAGTLITVTANDYAANGYTFSGWEVGPQNAELTLENSASPTVTFAMPAGDTMLTAKYTDENGAQVNDPAQPALAESETQSETGTEPVQTEAPTETETEPVQSETAAETALAPTEISQSGEQAVDAPTYGAEETPTTTSATGTPASENGAPQAQPIPLTIAGGTATDTAGAEVSAVTPGVTINVTASVPAGQQFNGWTATKNGSAEAVGAFADPNVSATTFTLPSDLTGVASVAVTANYKPIEYQIRVNSGSASCEKAASGTAVTITAGDAPKGMEFDYWKVDTGNVSLQNAYSATTAFAMPMADVTVSANYKMKEYRVTVQNGYSDEEVYYMGDEVTVYSNYPSSGREFDQWERVKGKVTFADASRWKTTFTMPARNVTVGATYKDGPSPENNQIQELVAGGEYITDSTIRFTAAGAGMDNANPNPGDYRYRPSGYQIGNVTGSWQESPYTTSMSIKARGDYTLKVTYNKEVFDGNTWAADGTSDTRSVSFRVLTPTEAVKTGDETPIAMMAALAGASCLMFLLLLSAFLRRRRNS